MRYLRLFESKKLDIRTDEREFNLLAELLTEIFDKYHVKYNEDDDYPPEDESYWEYSYNDDGDMSQLNIVNIDLPMSIGIESDLKKMDSRFENFGIGIGFNTYYDADYPKGYYIVITAEFGKKIKRYLK